MKYAVAFDIETYLIRAGTPCPTVVCLSYCGEDEQPGLLLRDDAIPFMHSLLDDPDCTLVAHNARFDATCLIAADPSLFPKFVQAIEQGRLKDTLVRDQLYVLGTSGLFEGEEGARKTVMFNLADVVKRRFNTDIMFEGKSKTKSKIGSDGVETLTVTGDASAWRLRYAELDNVPISEWPEAAAQYAMDDSLWTIRVYKDQGDYVVNETEQTMASFWLHLMSCYGVRTDPDYVLALEKRLRREFTVQNFLLCEVGLLKQVKVPKAKRKIDPATGQEVLWTLGRDMKELRRKVALAYGGSTALEKLEAIFAENDRQSMLKKEAAKIKAKAKAAAKKAGVEYVPPEPEISEESEQEDSEESGEVKIVDGVPMSDGGQVGTDRDTLQKLVHPGALKAAKEAYLTDLLSLYPIGQPGDDLVDATLPSIRPYSDYAAQLYSLDPDTFYNELILHEVGDRSGVEKLLSTFVPVLLQGTSMPINPRWNTLVATGRTSGSNPNLQQLPRKGGVRECFIPRPGYWYAACDYSAVELCTLSQVCMTLFGYSKLADAINSGMDPHLIFAAQLLSTTYEDVLARYEADEELVKEMRQCAKAANFGYPGGLGAESFQSYARATYGVVLTKERAVEVKAVFLKTWPEMRAYSKYIGSLSGDSHEFTITQHTSNRKRAGCTFNSGSNSFFQGLAADGAKLAGWLIMRECYFENPYDIPNLHLLPKVLQQAIEVLRIDGPSPLYGSRPVVFVHDEFIIETPIEKASDATDRLGVLMRGCMKVYTPDVASKTEAALQKRWLKGAKPVHDKDGKLIPWEPKKK